ncbi:MAG: hypothetical protein KAI22_04325 [Gammaproteobacteria bacterium]|nr:hypothetical protein [Gammaproteobacteria bacterium]
MISVKNKLFFLYIDNADTNKIMLWGHKFKLRPILAIMVFIFPFLSGCGTPFIASKQDDLLTQIDVWSADNEYGKAFATLNYVKSSHPQYPKLQQRKKFLLIQANEYEQHIDKQIQQFINVNQWAQALDLLDQAKQKYPLVNAENKNRGIIKTEKNLLQQQQRLLASIERNIMLERSQWLIKARPLYQQKVNTDPRNKALKIRVEDLHKESQLLSGKLTQRCKEAIDKKHYKTAKSLIHQAIALESTKKRQKILYQLQNREKKSSTKIQQTQDATRVVQQNTLLQDIEKSYNAGDLLKTKQLISMLDENEQNNIQLIELKQDLERSINYTIQQLVSEANKSYTDGQFHQAIELWEQVLMYNPQNTLAKKNIQRAEKVIDKLQKLREKQQN